MKLTHRKLVVLAGFLAATGPLMAQTNEERRLAIEQHQNQLPSQEALDRKARSVARLQAEGVPVSRTLPVFQDSRQVKTRTKEEIAGRAIAICLAAVKGEGLEQATVDALVKKHGADKFFSPEEAAFIHDLAPTREDRIKFSWRYEDYWVLLWSLGYVDKLERPEGICDVAKAVSFLRERDTAQFVKDATLRPLGEILDQADLIYRYSWAVVDARVKKQEAPAKLEGGVVQERHYVLNWLTGYMDQGWDDISTDT